MLVVSDRIRIPLREIGFRYVRSSGPGGQNVNKVSSKAELRWPIDSSESLPPDVRERFLARYGARVNVAGELVLTSDRHRDRERNREDCLERLRTMLAAVAEPPRPRKRTRPGRGAVERRLDQKRARGAIKKERRLRDRDG